MPWQFKHKIILFHIEDEQKVEDWLSENVGWQWLPDLYHKPINHLVKIAFWAKGPLYWSEQKGYGRYFYFKNKTDIMAFRLAWSNDDLLN